MNFKCCPNYLPGNIVDCFHSSNLRNLSVLSVVKTTYYHVDFIIQNLPCFKVARPLLLNNSIALSFLSG